MSCFVTHLELFRLVTLPCNPCAKSAHPTMYPGCGFSLQRMLKLVITLSSKSVFQMYKWVISPIKLCSRSKAPPITSWSCPKMNFPDPRITPCIDLLPVSLFSPSTNNFTTPSLSAHLPHKWCQFLSLTYPV